MEETNNILPLITAASCTLSCYLAVALYAAKRARDAALNSLIQANMAIIAMVDDPVAFEKAKKHVRQLRQLNDQLRRSAGSEE